MTEKISIAVYACPLSLRMRIMRTKYDVVYTFISVRNQRQRLITHEMGPSSCWSDRQDLLYLHWFTFDLSPRVR